MLLSSVARVFAISAVAVVGWSHSASAGNCLAKADAFELNSDTVHWSFAIRANSECLQGLRGKSMLIDSVTAVENPSAGRLTISGPAFFYQAPATAAVDRFKLRVVGENNRIRGNSEIIVEVSVR